MPSVILLGAMSLIIGRVVTFLLTVAVGASNHKKNSAACLKIRAHYNFNQSINLFAALYIHNTASTKYMFIPRKLQDATGHKTDVTPATKSRDFDARLRRASKSHRIEQRSIPKTSRATVRRAMTQRATRSVTLATLTRDPLPRDFVGGVTSV